MKIQLNKLTWLVLVAGSLLTACKKDTTKDVSKTVTVSYPEITLNGDAIVKVAVGAAYTDAGAKLKDDITGKISDIQPTSSNVNTATPGLYTVNFTAANENGFETSVTRLVAVTSVNNAIDYSGTYLRTATGEKAFVTRIAPGVYKVVNPGGATIGRATTVYFVETAPDVFTAPNQPTDAGTMSVINIKFTSTGATWNVLNALYGTGQRVFIKQ